MNRPRGARGADDRAGSDRGGRDRGAVGGRRILVDAANVAFTNRDAAGEKASVENLLAMRQRLKELGFQPIFIADATLKYKVDDEERLRRLEQDDVILEAPAGTQADYFLLAYSTREGVPIISNDAYRDRSREFPAAVARRVPFMIVDGEVIIDREILDRVEEGGQASGVVARGA